MQHKKIVTTAVRTETRILITGTDITELIRKQHPDMPRDAKVEFLLPYSGTFCSGDAIEVDSTAPVVVSWSTETRTETGG